MAFVQNFATLMIQGKDINSSMNMKQNPRKSIRDFIKRFAREMIEAENVDQAAANIAMTRVIRSRGLRDSLVKSRPQT